MINYIKLEDLDTEFYELSNEFEKQFEKGLEIETALKLDLANIQRHLRNATDDVPEESLVLGVGRTFKNWCYRRRVMNPSFNTLFTWIDLNYEQDNTWNHKVKQNVQQIWDVLSTLGERGEKLNA